MRFTPKQDIRKGRTLFEPENSYDPAKHGVDESSVERWYKAGLCEIEGRDPAPPVRPGRAEVQPDTATGAQKTTGEG